MKSPDISRGIVLVAHGIHEHCLRYYTIAKSLTALNFAVYGIDHYAHGKSPGNKGLITDFSILTEDFLAFATLVQESNPGLPIFVVAHSMGTLVSQITI